MATQHEFLPESDKELAVSSPETFPQAVDADIIDIEEYRQRSVRAIGQAATAQVSAQPKARSNRITADYFGPRNRRFQVMDAVRMQEEADYERWFREWSNEVKNRPPEPKNYDP